jgi:hypothetical protein
MVGGGDLVGYLEFTGSIAGISWLGQLSRRSAVDKDHQESLLEVASIPSYTGTYVILVKNSVLTTGPHKC